MVFKIQYVISFALEFVVFLGRVCIIHNFYTPLSVMQKVFKSKGHYSFWLKNKLKSHYILHMSGLLGISKNQCYLREFSFWVILQNQRTWKYAIAFQLSISFQDRLLPEVQKVWISNHFNESLSLFFSSYLYSAHSFCL